VRSVGIVQPFCHSEERSDEESPISPPPGERHREGVLRRLTTYITPPNEYPLPTDMPLEEPYPKLKNEAEAARILRERYG